MSSTGLEELRRIALFDGKAELTPESRLAWQKIMETRTRFLCYPGPKPDGLNSLEFWLLEHYKILSYFMKLQTNGVPAKVFFSLVNTCCYVPVAERTEHLELRGLTGQRLVVSPEVIREAFGISREAAQDEERGAMWPNVVFPRWHEEVENQGVRQYLPVQKDRYLVSAVSAFLKLTQYRHVKWVHMLAEGLASAVKGYVKKFLEGTAEAIVDVYWALALIHIIKHNWAQLFGFPLNCLEPWEVYEDCSARQEQEQLLRSIYSRAKEFVAKDALPRLLRLEPLVRIKNVTPEDQRPAPPRKRRAQSAAPAREAQLAPHPTRAAQNTSEPDLQVLPSPEWKVQELSSSSPEQPPRKEPRVERPQPETAKNQEAALLPGS
ncbi:hypothetical protein R1flu_026404 [Riccia fluitans]|uniref:Uncharacterized protein n=1 Tax=Riccia fluitans TaxID=41844 RepID=A0ABD1XIS7_9MARC